ncbi:MAG TPA: acetylglutamate kinase [Bryobacteraceae bacterium]|nr:acetylglutamate kinase [Bryobacteraceae bacterium]
MKILVKLGGTLLDSGEARLRLGCEIAALRNHADVVVVHGGGKQMTRYLEARGIESRFINGQRVTTPEILDGVLKIFAGSVNSTLVSALRAAGAMPVGLTGIDAGLLDAAPADAELGHVGRPVHSDSRLLEILLREGYLPVIACVAGDARGAIYNINGDQMAAACASSLRADKLFFLTDVEGVRDGSGRIVPALSAAQARQLICSGAATGGMRAKLEAALSALGNGVPEIVIAPGSCPGIIQKLTDRAEIGTYIS